MKEYVKFNIECTTKDKKLKKTYVEFKEKLGKFIVDEGMQLYRIPYNTEEYQYAHELAVMYYWDWNREDNRDVYPGLYIDEDEYVDIEYSRDDYNNACGYLVNFHYFAYPYENISDSDYVGNCCSNPQWSIDHGMIQNKTYQIPSSEFKKRQYAKLMIGYAVSEEVKEMLIGNRVATEKDFREVTNKNNKVVCYQIYPENILEGFARDNNIKVVDRCENCGLERYEPSKEPYYMSKEVVEQLKGLNRTKELEGSVIETAEFNKEREKLPMELEPLYIVNREVYLLLHKNYPRMQFIPIFPK